VNRYTRALLALYLAVFAWLAYCTVQTWSQVPAWSSTVMAAGSLAVVVAGFREAEHADDLRGLRVELEHASRPAPVTDPLVIPDDERARFDEITAGFEDAA